MENREVKIERIPLDRLIDTLVDLYNKGITGRDAEILLGRCGITVNKNMVPGDNQLPMVTSGIRIGTPAITTRGLLEEDMIRVAHLINDAIVGRDNIDVINYISGEVRSMMSGRLLFNSDFVEL